jgi:GNAT superfamily N-acetyltransferase
MESAARIPRGYRIRRPLPEDLGTLVAIEMRAARLFAHHGYPQIAEQPKPVSQFESLLTVNEAWVAVTNDDAQVGFAVAGDVGSAFYLKELSVDPDHGRRGVGAALLEAFIVRARRLNFLTASLSTFRDVPFNAPFYARHGFSIVPLDDAADSLKRQFFAELPAGIAAESRVLMIHRF